MKKLFLEVAIACFILMLIDNPALAAGNEGKPYFKSFIESASPASASLVNKRAITDFRGRYAGASSLNWYAVKGGFMTYFVIDGLPDRAFYDTKGRWHYSLIFYKEDKMPRDIRAEVKHIYYDYMITLIQEVQTNNASVYMVYLEDAKTIRIVKVYNDGEMETTELFEKQ